MNDNIRVRIRNLSFAYNDSLVLDRVSADFESSKITAITGPSGQGKSTLLTAINRLADEIPGAKVQGSIELFLQSGKRDVYGDKYYVPELRRQVGLVFQKPNPLPLSIIGNVLLPLRLLGRFSRRNALAKCEQALRGAFLWEEVSDRLNSSALELSGGQQQRLCIARSLVLEPEILMLDEPTSSLDTDAAREIEDLLLALKERCTVIIVSHYLEQVSRIADATYGISAKKLAKVSD
jgi:phosphate transport system ATP-binding protein